MDRRTRRTVIDIGRHQSELDFDEAALSPPFTFPEYQKSILTARFLSDLTDIAIVAIVYLFFIAATAAQMPEGVVLGRQAAGVYAAGFLILIGVYFLLFMLSASQTPGMKSNGLVAVTRDGALLDPRQACLRGFGYFISIIPLMLGFVWALIDPEHLGWADKVSGTYLKKI